MNTLKLIVASALALAFVGSVAITPTANALEGKAYIGGGSGIKFGNNAGQPCTLTTIGNDSQGNLVGISVGHCAEAAKTTYNDPTFADVRGENDPDAGVIGTVVYHKFSGGTANYTNPANRDYSVIKFDKTKVVPLKTVGRTTINGIAATAPAWWSNVCKEGRTTAQTCGMVTGTNAYEVKSFAFSAGGDSGAPLVNTSDGKLVGYVQRPEGIPMLSATVSLSIKPVLSDITSRGGVGAGFAPVQQ
ncbi:MAG: serine protease [Chloroflexi bacterium]|nr:MAG: serine protease [Chloroflexota bacterium]